MPTSKHELGWDNDHERQRLWVHVGGWDYKVFVESLKSHRTLFQFEGAVSRESGLAGLKVLGDIEIPFEILYLDEDEPPPDDLGTFHLVGGEANLFVGLTLLVAPETFAELFRVFSAAFGNNGGLGLQLDLKHPKGAEPDFWRTMWQKEGIQISHFGFYLGGHFRETKGLAKLFS